jgi:F-type H+-transporting ATPase subunit O
MSRSSALKSLAQRASTLATTNAHHGFVAPLSAPSSPWTAAATFATKSATSTPKLPPQFGIPGRYAAALYMASFKNNTLDKVQKEVHSLMEVIRASPELKTFVNEPGMPAKTRSAGLAAVLDKVGVSTAVTKRFVDVVVENKRTSDLEGMLAKFDEIVAQQKGEVKASVTTAKALSKAELENVKSGLSKVMKKGETLVLEEKVDPSIISGIIIDVGDKHVDMSVQTRVKKLQQLIRNA